MQIDTCSVGAAQRWRVRPGAETLTDERGDEPPSGQPPALPCRLSPNAGLLPTPLFSCVSSLIVIRKDTACKLSSEFNSQDFSECQKEFIKLSDQIGANAGNGQSMLL